MPRNSRNKREAATAKVTIRYTGPGRRFIKSNARRQAVAQVIGRKLLWHGQHSSGTAHVRYPSHEAARETAVAILTNLPRCAWCGETFEGRRDKQYCSPAHKQAAWRARKLKD